MLTFPGKKLRLALPGSRRNVLQKSEVLPSTE
jgi:hypothetical protein